MSKMSRILLGLFDLLLSFAAIGTGYLMLSPDKSVFAHLPESWKTFGPLDSWIMPGFVAIIIFGTGNMIAGLCCLSRKCKNPGIISVCMLAAMVMAVGGQLAISHEWYLASVECLAAAVLQALSALSLMTRKNP